MDFLPLLIHPNQTIMRVTVATAQAAGKHLRQRAFRLQCVSAQCVSAQALAGKIFPAGTGKRGTESHSDREMGLVKCSATSVLTAPVQRSLQLGIITMDRWIKRTSF